MTNPCPESACDLFAQRAEMFQGWSPRPVFREQPITQIPRRFLAAIGGARANADAETLSPPVGKGSKGPGANVALPAPDAALPWEEEIKNQLHPLDAFPRLLECASENRPPGPEDRFRFQWHGLFYQAPERDAFILRIRLPGGRLTTRQLGGLADLTQEHASGYLLLNSQGGLDVPGVSLRAAADVLALVEGMGLSARQTGGDCVWAVRGGEIEGLNDGNLPPTIYPLVCELERLLADRRDLANLPGGCEFEFRDGGEKFGAENAASGETVVVQALPVPVPERGDTAPRGEEDSFLFVPPGDGRGTVLTASRVITACLNLLEAWAAHGDRTNRRRASLSEFCMGIGLEALHHLLGQNKPYVPGAIASGRTGCDGRRYLVGITVPQSRILSAQLTRLGEIAHAQALDEVRFAGGQLYVGKMENSATRQAFEGALQSFQSAA